MAIIKAPFTIEQVQNLNHWQASGVFHPFTCGTPMKHHSTRESNILIATPNGWQCPSCDYTQNWAHDFMAQPMPERDEFGRFLEENAEVTRFPEDVEEAREYLKAHGYDPDEVAKRGVTFVRMASLVAKIKELVKEGNYDPGMYGKVQQIRELIRKHEEETKS